MTAFEFMGSHPILTLLLACIVASAFCYPFQVLNRWISHRNATNEIEKLKRGVGC